MTKYCKPYLMTKYCKPYLKSKCKRCCKYCREWLICLARCHKVYEYPDRCCPYEVTLKEALIASI